MARFSLRQVLALVASALLMTTGFGAAHATEPSASPSGGTSSRAPSPSHLPSVPTIDTPRGDSIRARQYWLMQYGFADLWKEATGQGVTVAVIDTGVDGNHQDLKGNVIDGFDASGNGSGQGWRAWASSRSTAPWLLLSLPGMDTPMGALRLTQENPGMALQA